MAGNMELQLLLKLNDQMSRGLKSAMTSVQKESKGVEAGVNAIARAANNIKPTGIMRMTEALNKAKSAAKSTLEMIQKTAQAGAAVAAGGYVLKAAADKPMAFDRRLALMANTAYSDRDVAGRIAGKAQLEASVRLAQKQGLGSQDDIAETLNQLVGSGAMGEGKTGLESSMRLLPSLAKAATGTGADAGDLAKLAIAAKQNLKLTDAEVPLFLSKAITAGNEGGFELKDMAKHLPAQMALYSANGMKGMKGGEDLLAYNQVARISAGTSDEAGINLINLLTKINSSDTQKDFQKQGINLTGSLAAARGKGMSTLDAFMALVSKVANKDKDYKALEARAKNEKGDEQKATLSAMMDIIQQKGIGLTVQDRQAMGALLGAKQNSEKLNDVRNKVRADLGGQIDANYGTVRNTASGAGEALANAKDKAASDSLKQIDGPLQSLLNGTASLSEKFPSLATAAYSATTAITAMAASAGIFALLGKGGAAKSAVSSIVKAASKPATGLAAGGSYALATGAAPLAAMAWMTSWVKDTTHDKDRVDWRVNLGKAIQSLFGDKEAEHAARRKKNQEGMIDYSAKPITVNVMLDGKQISSSVNAQNSRQASRK